MRKFPTNQKGSGLENAKVTWNAPWHMYYMVSGLMNCVPWLGLQYNYSNKSNMYVRIYLSLGIYMHEFTGCLDLRYTSAVDSVSTVNSSRHGQCSNKSMYYSVQDGRDPKHLHSREIPPVILFRKTRTRIESHTMSSTYLSLMHEHRSAHSLIWILWVVLID